MSRDSKDGKKVSHRQKKKSYIQHYGSPPGKKQHGAHRPYHGPGRHVKAAAPHFTFEQRLTQTFYTYHAFEIKKRLVRAAHSLYERFEALDIFEFYPGVTLNKKVLKKQIKRRISERIGELINEREELPHDLRQYSDLHGLLEHWEADLKEVDDEGIRRLQSLLHYIFAEGQFDLHRVYHQGHKKSHTVLRLNLEDASATLANSPYNDAILVILDLMIQGVPEMKKVAVAPLLENAMQAIDIELASAKTQTCFLDLALVGNIQVLGQEGFLKGLIGSLLDLRQHQGYPQIARQLQAVAKSGELALRSVGGLGPHLFTVLFQLVRGLGKLHRVNLSGARWIPKEQLVDFILRHSEIEFLDLSHCRQLGTRSLEKISHVLVNLRELRVSGLDRVDGSIFEEMVAANYHLETIDISECDQVSSSNLITILQILEEREAEVHLDISDLMQVSPEEAEELSLSILGEQAIGLRV